MQNLKPKIQNLMRLGLQAAKHSYDASAVRSIQEEGQSLLDDIDAMMKPKPSRKALIAARNFRQCESVAAVGDQLVPWEYDAGTLLAAARDIKSGEMVEWWPGENSPDLLDF